MHILVLGFTLYCDWLHSTVYFVIVPIEDKMMMTGVTFVLFLVVL